MTDPTFWITAFWVCAGLGTIGTVVAAISLIRSGGDNYQK